MNNLDHKDLENQGWDAMFQTLEQEMPQKKKRRGLLWLFLIVGGLAAVGGGYGYTQMKHKTTKKIETTLINKPIAENTEGVQLSESFVSQSNIHSSTPKLRKLSKFPELNPNKKAIGLVNFVAADFNPPLKNSIRTLSSVGTTHLQSAVPTELKNNDIINNGGLKSAATKLTDPIGLLSTNLLIPNAQDLKLDASLAAIENIVISPLPMVSGSAISINRDSNQKIKNLPIIATISKKKDSNNKLTYGITAGIHTQLFNQIDGFQAGLVIQKPLSKRWGLGAGLQVRQTTVIRENIKFYLSYDKSASSISVTSPALQSTTPVSLDKLYYLEIPVVGQYKLDKHFAFASGLKTACLIRQTVKVTGTNVYYVNGAASNYSQANLKTQTTAKALGINRLDAAWMSSISYSSNKHINFSLNYDFGFFNNTPTKTLKTYNRFVGLNGTYFF